MWKYPISHGLCCNIQHIILSYWYCSCLRMTFTPVGLNFLTLYPDLWKRVSIPCSNQFLIMKGSNCFGIESAIRLRGFLLLWQYIFFPGLFLYLKCLKYLSNYDTCSNSSKLSYFLVKTIQVKKFSYCIRTSSLQSPPTATHIPPPIFPSSLNLLHSFQTHRLR